MPQELFAEKIYLALKGIGTDEETLSRVLVSRSELDISDIKDIYQKKYKKSLKDDISDNILGNYQKLCIFLCEK